LELVRAPTPHVVSLMAADTFDIHVSVASTMGVGRQLLRDGLLGWGCGNDADVVLVFSELVTNAIVHTAAASTTVITHQPPNVRIDVHDTSHTIPEMRYDTRPGGVGLRIVSQLSDSWGWNQTPTGKIVWSITRCGH
jgi:anti-sigma regulatory factor (Ser/Thr protein kinase)